MPFAEDSVELNRNPACREADRRQTAEDVASFLTTGGRVRKYPMGATSVDLGDGFREFAQKANNARAANARIRRARPL